MAKRRGRGNNPAKALQQRHLAQKRFIEAPTGRQAGKVAHKEAGLEFNPVIRQMRAEARGSQKREGQISDWYGQLGSDYGQSQQASQDAFKAAEDATNQRLAEAGQRGNAAVQGLSAEDAKFAALVGGPTDAPGNATRATAQQAAERQATTLTAPLTAQSANYTASIGSKRTAAALRGIEAHKEEGERRVKIKQDLGKAKRERGSATVVDLEKLREAARNYQVQRSAFSQKKGEAAISAKQAAARIGVEKTNAATSARNAATTERSQAATEKHYHHSDRNAARKARRERKLGGRTPAEVRAEKAGRQNATAEAQTLYRAYEAAGKPPRTPAEWATFQQLVADKSEVSPADASAAVKRLQAEAKRKESIRGAIPHFP